MVTVMPEHSTCASCGAPILWVRTAATNSLMPLDFLPIASGNVVIKDGLAHVMKGDLFEEMMAGERYQSHFVSCSNSQKHRKKK